MKGNYPKITEGLFIASIPVAGYFLAYVFELGYCHYFKIPKILIDLNLINIISTIIAVISTYFLIFFTFDSIIYRFISNANRVIKWSLIRISTILFSLIGFSIINNWSIEFVLKYCSPLIAGLIFMEFGFPLITQRKTPGFINKLETQREIDFKDIGIFEKIMQSIGPKIFLVFYIFYLLSIATYFAGGLKARLKTEFLTSTKSPDVIYLRKYGSLFIGNKYDRKTNTLTNQFIIEPINENLVTVEIIGQLKPYNYKILSNGSTK